jgi:hypothetical protein
VKTVDENRSADLGDQRVEHGETVFLAGIAAMLHVGVNAAGIVG